MMTRVSKPMRSRRERCNSTVSLSRQRLSNGHHGFGNRALDLPGWMAYVGGMLWHRTILLLCLTSHIVIAIHPAFVSVFAYAEVGAKRCARDDASALAVTKARRPLEVLAIHRVPSQFVLARVVSFLSTRDCVDSEPCPRVQAPDPEPDHLAEDGRTTLLRQHSLLI